MVARQVLVMVNYHYHGKKGNYLVITIYFTHHTHCLKYPLNTITIDSLNYVYQNPYYEKSNIMFYGDYDNKN